METGIDFWAPHVEAIKHEAVSSSAYAKRHGLSVAAVYYWQRKLRAAPASRGSKFVALNVADAAGNTRSGPCTLVLASGMRLEMSTLPAPEWLAALGRAAQGAR